MAQDTSYFVSGYIDETYFARIAMGEAGLLVNSQLIADGRWVGNVQFISTESTQSQIIINNIKVVSYVGYTIFDPISISQPFSLEYFSQEPV